MITVFLNACGSSRRTVQKPASKINTEPSVVVINTSPEQVYKSPKKRTVTQRTKAYIKEFLPVARAEMKKYGIPASITLAQGILESGMGESRLATKANNHFGIKCHKSWRGKEIRHDDDKRNECFRVYKTPMDSYRDHSLFLAKRNRYAFLFDLKKTNYKGWAKGLKKAGYATDPRYASKLIDLIERFNLNYYDRNKHAKKRVNSAHLLESVKHKVEKGDTLYSISKQYNVSIELIKSENTIDGNTIYLGQVLKIPNSK